MNLTLEAFCDSTMREGTTLCGIPVLKHTSALNSSCRLANASGRLQFSEKHFGWQDICGVAWAVVSRKTNASHLEFP